MPAQFPGRDSNLEQFTYEANDLLKSFIPCVQVAVKVVDKKRAKADPYVRKNLRREGRLLQQVRHSHVVQLMEVRPHHRCHHPASVTAPSQQRFRIVV